LLSHGIGQLGSIFSENAGEQTRRAAPSRELTTNHLIADADR
jgi:hypothetical protein